MTWERGMPNALGADSEGGEGGTGEKKRQTIYMSCTKQYFYVYNGWNNPVMRKGSLNDKPTGTSPDFSPYFQFLCFGFLACKSTVLVQWSSRAALLCDLPSTKQQASKVSDQLGKTVTRRYFPQEPKTELKKRIDYWTCIHHMACYINSDTENN